MISLEYIKPELSPLGFAIQAVQSSSSDKADPLYQDSQFTKGTNAAYEADE